MLKSGNYGGEEDDDKDVTAKFNDTLDNTRETMSFMKAFFDVLSNGDPDNVIVNYIRMDFFRRMVTTGGPLDLKSDDYGQEAIGYWSNYNGNVLRFDDYGNYNYGAAAKAFGLSLSDATTAAGIAQVLHGGADWGNPAGVYDEYRDTQMITNGYNGVYEK